MLALYRLLLYIGVLLFLATRAAGQAGAGPGDQPNPDPLDALRAKTVFTDEDRQALRAWIMQRVEALVSGSGGEAVVQLRGATARGSPAFREAFAQAATELSRPLISRAPLAPAAQLVTLLVGLEDMSTLEVLLESLADERAAVRTAAAVGLARLRKKIAAAGPGPFTRCIEALRDAGRRETAPEALKAIYRAMDYGAAGTVPDAQLAAAALLELVLARSEKYASGQPPAEGADLPGIRLAWTMRARFSEEQRQRYILALARMLRQMVLRYASELHKVQDNVAGSVAIAARNDAELLIAEAEAQLTELIKPSPAPNIRERMKGKDGAFNAKLELNKWADILQPIAGQSFRAEITAEEDGG